MLGSAFFGSGVFFFFFFWLVGVIEGVFLSCFIFLVMFVCCGEGGDVDVCGCRCGGVGWLFLYTAFHSCDP